MYHLKTTRIQFRTTQITANCSGQANAVRASRYDRGLAGFTSYGTAELVVLRIPSLPAELTWNQIAVNGRDAKKAKRNGRR